MTVEEAGELADSRGEIWRVTRIDGVDQTVRLDLRPGRLNFHVVDGVVTDVIVEGGDDGGHAPTTVPETTTTVGPSTLLDIATGDCFNEDIAGMVSRDQLATVPQVDCDTEHRFELYREALVTAEIEVFDEVAIAAYADEVCQISLDAYARTEDHGLEFIALQPTADTWNSEQDPDRVVACLLFSDELLVGRIG